MTRRNRILACLSLGLLAGCSPELGVMPVEIDRYIVGPDLVTCQGIFGPEQCMLVRRPDSSSPSWSHFHGAIEGFSPEPGYFNEIEIEVFRRSGPPVMDSSDRLYRLKRIVRRDPVGPVAFVR